MSFLTPSLFDIAADATPAPPAPILADHAGTLRLTAPQFDLIWDALSHDYHSANDDARDFAAAAIDPSHAADQGANLRAAQRATERVAALQALMDTITTAIHSIPGDDN
jgi:hypothetical protein